VDQPASISVRTAAARSTRTLGAMRRYLSVLVLSISMLGCAATGRNDRDSQVSGLDDPDALVLRVRVISNEATDLYNSSDCSEKSDSTADTLCIPMYFWFRYKARVVGVAKGQWAGEFVEFANYQHSGYAPELLNDCYVVLVKPGSSLAEKLAVPYVSEDIVFSHLQRDKGRLRTLLHGT
jgi:hypothetical protein